MPATELSLARLLAFGICLLLAGWFLGWGLRGDTVPAGGMAACVRPPRARHAQGRRPSHRPTPTFPSSGRLWSDKTPGSVPKPPGTGTPGRRQLAGAWCPRPPPRGSVPARLPGKGALSGLAPRQGLRAEAQVVQPGGAAAPPNPSQLLLPWTGRPSPPAPPPGAPSDPMTGPPPEVLAVWHLPALTPGHPLPPASPLSL